MTRTAIAHTHAQSRPLPDLAVYYINLDRSEDRRVRLESRLSALCLNTVRFPAINGTDLPETLPEINPLTYRKCHGRHVRAGEIGCYLSHIGAMRLFLEGTAAYALILEDDAEIGVAAVRVLESLVSPETPKDWDFVKLQSRRSTRVLTLRPVCAGYDLAVPLTRSTGATAYLVTRKAAKKLCESLLPIHVPYDHAFDRPFFLGLRYRMVVPFPITLAQASGASTIETSRPLKCRGIEKLSALCWRAQSETTRFIWSLGSYAKFHSRRWWDIRKETTRSP